MKRAVQFFPPNLQSLHLGLLPHCWSRLGLVQVLLERKHTVFPGWYDVSFRVFVDALYQVKKVPFHST